MCVYGGGVDTACAAARSPPPQAVHGARDQAESLQTLEAYPLTKAHMAKLLPDSTAVSVSGPMNPLQLLNIYKVQVDLVVHETITADQPDITMPGRCSTAGCA